MIERTNLWTTVRAALLPAGATVLIALSGGYAVFGANGMLAWRDHHIRLEARTAELAKVELRRAALAQRVALLDPRRADPDLVDELVRRDLGVTHPDEVVVPLR